MFEIDIMALENKDLYYDSTFSYFEDQFGNIGTKPPWGEIVALDITSGDQLWKKPIGKLNDEIIGTPIYGGLATNNGDILIVTGTQDKLVYFINQNNGKILKTFKNTINFRIYSVNTVIKDIIMNLFLIHSGILIIQKLRFTILLMNRIVK